MGKNTKYQTTTMIPEDLRRRARDCGLNVSAVCRMALTERIEQIEESKTAVVGVKH